jgi:hypothetical protein
MCGGSQKFNKTWEARGGGEKFHKNLWRRVRESTWGLLVARTFHISADRQPLIWDLIVFS